MSTTNFYRNFEYFSEVSTLSRKSVCCTCIYRFSLKSDFENLPTENREQVIDFLESTLMKYDCSEKIVLHRLLHCILVRYFHDFGCDAGNDKKHMFELMDPLKTVLLNRRHVSLSRMNLAFFPCFTSAKFLLVLSKYGIHIGRSVFSLQKARNTIENFLYVFSFLFYAFLFPSF